MRFFNPCILFMLISHHLIIADEIFIPQSFKEGQSIEQLILISDVDGVVRDSVDGLADFRVIEAVKALLKHEGVNVTFISGTPIESNQSTLEPWRQGNVPLNKVFGSLFESEMLEERVAIFGVLGGHRMNRDGSLEVVDEYSPEIACELSVLLIHAFLNEVLRDGNAQQKMTAAKIKLELDSCASTSITDQEFKQIVLEIREHLDPNFRQLSNGAIIETHTSNPPWGTHYSAKWLHEEMNKPEYLVSHLEPWQRKIATGFAKKGEDGFNYLLISKTNKGVTTEKHIEELIKRYPQALVVTIGDTQVDFPMHQNAHLAFHVGLEHVWQNHSLPQCMMIRNSHGHDSQHIEGTLKVLQLLADGIGKSFHDLKYIPKQDSSGKWNYHSINEIQ